MKASRIDITNGQHLINEMAAGWTHVVVLREFDESDGSPFYSVLAKSRSLKGGLSLRKKHQGMEVHLFELKSLLLVFASSVREVKQ